MDTSPFTLHEGKFIFWIGAICGAFNLLILAFAIPSTILQQDYIGTWFCGVVFGGFALLGAILVLAQLNRKLYISLENCEFTSTLGRKKAFPWSDIGFAKQSLTNLTYSLRLFDKDGKRIVQIESTMTDADRLLNLLEEQGIEIISPISEMQKRLEQDWNNPGDKHAWQFRSRTFIRKMNSSLILLSIASIVLYFILPTQLGIGLLTLSAILPYVLMLIFPQVILPNLSNRAPGEWKEAHIEFAYLSYMLPLLLIILSVQTINFVSWISALVFGIVLYALLIALYFVRTPKFLWTMGNAISISIMLIMFCFAGTYSINYALRFHKSVHEPVAIVDTHTSDGKMTSYYVNVRRQDGTLEEFSTSHSTYKLAEDSIPLRRCLRTSIFGISFVTLHE